MRAVLALGLALCLVMVTVTLVSVPLRVEPPRDDGAGSSSGSRPATSPPARALHGHQTVGAINSHSAVATPSAECAVELLVSQYRVWARRSIARVAIATDRLNAAQIELMVDDGWHVVLAEEPSALWRDGDTAAQWLSDMQRLTITATTSMPGMQAPYVTLLPVAVMDACRGMPGSLRALAFAMAVDAQVVYWVMDASAPITDWPRYYAPRAVLPQLQADNATWAAEHFVPDGERAATVTLCTKAASPVIQLGLCPGGIVRLSTSPGLVLPAGERNAAATIAALHRRALTWNIIAYRPAFWLLVAMMGGRGDQADTLARGISALGGLGYDAALLAPGSICGDSIAPFDRSQAQPRMLRVARDPPMNTACLSDDGCSAVSGVELWAGPTDSVYDPRHAKPVSAGSLLGDVASAVIDTSDQMWVAAFQRMWQQGLARREGDDPIVNYRVPFAPPPGSHGDNDVAGTLSTCFFSAEWVRDVALAVVYNAEFEKVPGILAASMPLLHRMYDRAFPSIRFYADMRASLAPQLRPDDHVVRFGAPRQALTSCATGIPWHGQSAHNCITAAADHAFGRLGLMWMMDDVFVHVWNVADWDHRRMWMGSLAQPCPAHGPDAGEVITDDQRQIAAAVLSSDRHCYEMACAEGSWTDANKFTRDGHWRRAEHYRCGHGSPWDWTTGGTDMWYAPRHGLVELTRLLHSMASGNTWIAQEWAMSTAFFLMSNGDDWIVMAGYRNHPGFPYLSHDAAGPIINMLRPGSMPQTPEEQIASGWWQPQWAWSHPFKASSAAATRFVLDKLERFYADPYEWLGRYREQELDRGLWVGNVEAASFTPGRHQPAHGQAKPVAAMRYQAQLLLQASTSVAGASSAVTGSLWSYKRQRRFAGPTAHVHRQGQQTRPHGSLRRAAHHACNPDHTQVAADGRPCCPKWVVMTTVFAPGTLVLDQLNRLPSDWCTVIVADKRTPSWPPVDGRITLLTASDQLWLPYATVKHLPWNHFGRKNLGYLFAIAHGARWIYDTDDDNLLKPLPPADTDGGDRYDIDTGVLEAAAHTFQSATPVVCGDSVRALRVFNPYPLFGAAGAWPRGLPLDAVVPTTTGCNATGVAAAVELQQPHTAGRIVIWQSLADMNPDVDAIFRLTRPPQFSFASTGGRMLAAVPAEGLYAPFNAQATLFHHDAFWSLLLPTTVHSRVSDIWRSYIAQRVMRDHGQRLAFTSPRVWQNRTQHDFLRDFDSEHDLYLKAGALLALLDGLHPPAPLTAATGNRDAAAGWTYFGTNSIAAHFEALMIDLFEHGVVEEADVLLAQAWLSDLVAMGYAFPGDAKRDDDVKRPP